MPITQGPIAVQQQTPLWRYVGLNTLFHYLMGKAFIPSIKTLRQGDPTEGLEVADHVWAMIGFSEEKRAALARWVYAHKLSAKGKVCFDNNRTHPGANQRLWLKYYYELMEETRYAWCWFKSEYESAAMWQVYGRGGVAIRSSLAALSKTLETTGHHWLGSGVKYLYRGIEAGLTVEKGDEDVKPWYAAPFSSRESRTLMSRKFDL